MTTVIWCVFILSWAQACQVYAFHHHHRHGHH